MTLKITLGIVWSVLLCIGCTITPAVVKQQTIIEDQGEISVLFCPEDECEPQLARLLSSAETSIHCALYEVELKSIPEALLDQAKRIDVAIVTDNDYVDKFNQPFVKADSYGLMHNKIF